MALESWLLVARVVCLLLATTATTAIIKAPNMNQVSSFLFLAVASCVEMARSAVCLLLQIACLWFGRARPSGTPLTVLIVLEHVLTSATMTAGCSVLGVAVFYGVDTDNCSSLPASGCAMYFISSTLAILVGILGIPIAWGMLWVFSHRAMVRQQNIEQREKAFTKRDLFYLIARAACFSLGCVSYFTIASVYITRLHWAFISMKVFAASPSLWNLTWFLIQVGTLCLGMEQLDTSSINLVLTEWLATGITTASAWAALGLIVFYDYDTQSCASYKYLSLICPKIELAVSLYVISGAINLAIALVKSWEFVQLFPITEN